VMALSMKRPSRLTWLWNWRTDAPTGTLASPALPVELLALPPLLAPPLLPVLVAELDAVPDEPPVDAEPPVVEPPLAPVLLVVVAPPDVCAVPEVCVPDVPVEVVDPEPPVEAVDAAVPHPATSARTSCENNEIRRMETSADQTSGRTARRPTPVLVGTASPGSPGARGRSP